MSAVVQMVHSMSRRNWEQRTVLRLILLRKAGGQSIKDNSFGYAADTRMKLNSDKLQELGWTEFDLHKQRKPKE